MIENVVAALRCPICQSAFGSGLGMLRCATGHSFDLAKQGYANLLTGRGPAGADTPAMVAARAELLAAGHLRPVTDAVVEAARATAASSGIVLDAGAGTGHYCAAVLAALPAHHGIAVDNAKAAARWAARAHPRLACVVADVWRRLPIVDCGIDLVLVVFAPRNGAEFHRVLRPDGHLLLLTPAPDHLAELVGPLGLVRIDPEKADRIDRGLGPWFEPLASRPVAYPLLLSRAETARLVAMGPSAWHLDAADLAQRLIEWPEPIRVTVSVTLQIHRRRPDAITKP
jgi:23S rRNA (guanine745-N1)-methyltransferase